MFEQLHHRLTLFLLSGLGLTACAQLQNDAYFAGFHANDPSGSTTPSIIDRGLLNTAPLPAESVRADVEPENPADPYRYGRQQRYRDDPFTQYNLMVHLYGPYYYRDYRSRLWLQHQRRWSRIPWFAYDPLLDDFWMADPFWRSRYGGWSGRYDPWYAGYYDPWYWDPYGGGYGLGYASYGGYYDYWPYGYIRRGTLATVAIKPPNHQQRRRGRKDLTTTMSAGKSRAAGPSSTQIRVGRSPGRTTTTGAVSVRRQGRSSSASSKDKSGGSRQARTRKRTD
ncbi:MAG: hypothetical protein IID14_01830 [Candidatus Marinimicrobia bacterium]|nr:hypothetical protein [Candidatus Neomarinimicrobiota bacterium]